MIYKTDKRVKPHVKQTKYSVFIYPAGERSFAAVGKYRIAEIGFEAALKERRDNVNRERCPSVASTYDAACEQLFAA